MFGAICTDTVKIASTHFYSSVTIMLSLFLLSLKQIPGVGLLA